MTKLGLFYIFLTKNNCLFKYVKAIKDAKNDRTLSWLNKASALDLIFGAFVWGDTIDGHNYWENLSMKWRIFYYDYRQKIID